MLRLFSKVGPWLLPLALVWYLGGQFLIHSLRTKAVAQAKSLHPNRQQFGVGQQLRLRIQAGDTIRAPVKLQFDPLTTQVVLDNPNLGVTAQGQLLGGVLHLTLTGQVQKTERGHQNYYPAEEITIHVPSSLQKIELAADHWLTLTGKPTVSALNLVLLDCNGKMKLEKMVVRQLWLTSLCANVPAEKNAANGFELGPDLAAESLAVTLPYGKLEFLAEKVPQLIVLNLGDTVQFTGRSEFFRPARFARLL